MINDQPKLECSGKSDYEQKISHFGSNTESTPASLGVVGHILVKAAERISEEGHDPAVPETPVGAGQDRCQCPLFLRRQRQDVVDPVSGQQVVGVATVVVVVIDEMPAHL